MTDKETGEQIQIFNWTCFASCTYPELKLLFHIPNGGYRNKCEAAKLKCAGVKAGVPDMCLPVARGGYNSLYIELKYGTNKPTVSQSEWIAELIKQGNRAVVCYGFDEAVEELKAYLDGKRIKPASICEECRKYKLCCDMPAVKNDCVNYCRFCVRGKERG